MLSRAVEIAVAWTVVSFSFVLLWVTVRELAFFTKWLRRRYRKGRESQAVPHSGQSEVR
jgi:hypothetical protein